MNERRKIVIQTGNEPDPSLETPHFDAEATLTARPVVPLGEDAAAAQVYAPRPVSRAGLRSPWLLVLIVVGAITLGVATGLAIGFYKNRQTSAPAVATEGVATEPSAPTPKEVEAERAAELPPAPTPEPAKPEEEARASVPEVEEEPRVQPRDERAERAARAEAEKRATPPAVVPEKPRPNDDDVITMDDVREERRAERQKRREERRERRRRERELELPAEFPREVERAGREGVNRIRDIFEGRQP